MTRSFVVFSGDGSNYPDSLWVTDGTAAGTVPLAVAQAGSGGLFYNTYGAAAIAPDLAQFGNMVLFMGVDAAGVVGLWRSDGTAAGTYEITVNGGNPSGVDAGGSSGDFAVLGGTAYFDGFDANNNFLLWSTQGTTATTAPVAVPNAAPDLNPTGLTGFAGGSKVLFFGYSTGNIAASSMYVITTAGVSNVQNIAPGTGFSPNPADGTAALGNAVVFGASAQVVNAGPAATIGPENLWITDGTAANTQPLTTNGVVPTFITSLGSFVLYAGETSTTTSYSIDLWYSGGSAASTYEAGARQRLVRRAARRRHAGFHPPERDAGAVRRPRRGGELRAVEHRRHRRRHPRDRRQRRRYRRAVRQSRWHRGAAPVHAAQRAHPVLRPGCVGPVRAVEHRRHLGRHRRTAGGQCHDGRPRSDARRPDDRDALLRRRHAHRDPGRRNAGRAPAARRRGADAGRRANRARGRCAGSGASRSIWPAIPRRRAPPRCASARTPSPRACRTATCWLSPDHAVLFQGALFHARALLNGAQRGAGVSRAASPMSMSNSTRHAVLLAEGLPAESYLDLGTRGCFDGEAGTRPLFPDLAAARWDARACAPLVLEGPRLDAVRAHLAARFSAGRTAARSRRASA